VVKRGGKGEGIVNEASILFFPADRGKSAPGKPYPIKLPDGYDTWAAAWHRGMAGLWVYQHGKIRSYDFTNPAQVKEATFERPASLDQVPRPIREVLEKSVSKK
jgi:hypothetical protein